ncbi:MAG TPA: hypothetical protein VL284_03535 [Thermoanaerobaculia bacterium]|nr:hypothetical protein [Thermoanaerobaculia bacterium]
MPSHLIFLTLFLGIVSGKQGIELQADPAIKSIRILLANSEIARLTQPPWRCEIDLGPEIVPRVLEAVGYDADGSEVARASQALNLPRPYADVQIVRDAGGAELRWSNVQYKPPKSARVTLDGAPLEIDKDYHVHFPARDDARPHVLDAELRFDDGVVARRETIVEGSEFSDTAEAQLTPVVVRETSPQHPTSLDGCFAIDGNPVRAAAVDKDKALVVFVQDPSPHDAVAALDPARRASSVFTKAEYARWVHLDDDTRQAVVWPVARKFTDRNGRETSLLFPHSNETPARSGLITLLTANAPFDAGGPREWTNAVAVAGLRAVQAGQRRAVVLVLTGDTDASRMDAGAVRRYLDAIGVPLFVWAPRALPPGAAERWGPITDISTIDRLRYATIDLRNALATQRVAWIAAPPLDALRVRADPACGFAR